MASKKVKMHGTGNFQIESTLYTFKDGEVVTAKRDEHIAILEAEAKRREQNAIKLDALEALREAEISKIK